MGTDGVSEASVSLGLRTDAQLVEAIARGCADSLREVHRRHGPRMRAVAMRRARLGEVDDVVQDVLLRLWLAPRSFDPQRGTLRTFLSMQASGRAIDLVRGAKARRDRETASFERTEAVVAGPEEQVLARIDAGEARSRVARLPAPERAAIEQAFFAGSSYREAADALGEPEGTIKSRIRRSLRRMEAMGSSPTAAVV